VVEEQPDSPLFIAWRTAHKGRALQWFLGRLEDAAVRAALLAEVAPDAH
jgi:hypothetical protein